MHKGGPAWQTLFDLCLTGSTASSSLRCPIISQLQDWEYGILHPFFIQVCMLSKSNELLGDTSFLAQRHAVRITGIP